MSAKTLLLLVAASALLSAAAAQGPVITWLNNNKDTTLAGEVLQSLYQQPISPNARFTLLVPTNAAVEAFLRDMGLTSAQFRGRTGLLDLVIAYHIIPGYQAKELKVAKNPTVGVTGDINYVLRFWNTDKGVNVEDLQGNNVTLSKPTIIGNAAVIVIDRVLMSGNYFFTGKQALNYYSKQWSEAAKLAAAVGFPEGTSKEQDMTFFVPDNKAMQAAASAANRLSNEDKKNLFLYHTTTPARSVPSDFKDGKLSTNFKGHDLTVTTGTNNKRKDVVTGKDIATPSLSLTSETGNKANVDLFNIFVGKSVWQGIDAVLIPKFDSTASKTQTEAGKKAGNRRLLLSWAAHTFRLTGRRLLYRGSSSNYGSSQMVANQVAQDNTARAIEAAATGSIPTSYATRYGSWQAQSAAQWGDCLNCAKWY